MILCDNIDKKLKELEAKPGANSRSANSINDKDDR